LGDLTRLGVHFVVLTLFLGLWCGIRRVPLPPRWGRIALLGIAVWALPLAVIKFAAGRLSGLTEALVFTLVPVAAVFVVAQMALGFGRDTGPRRLVAPALAGVVGAALLIPFEAPPSETGKIWLGVLAVMVILATLAAVGLHKELQGGDLVPAAVVTAAAVSCFALGAGWDLAAFAGMGRPAWGLELVVALLVDGPLLLLGLWVMREMPPIGAATRYPVTLLVTVGESYVLLHGSAGWAMVLGASLMAGSAGWLLWASTQPDTGDTGGTLGLS
jgi:hypothetical protein